MPIDAEVQRSLGRIEGTQAQILAELKTLREDFGAHVQADQANFSDGRALSYALNNDVKLQIDAMKTAKAVLQGQLTLGQKVLAILGAGAAFAWSVFIAFWQPHH